MNRIGMSVANVEPADAMNEFWKIEADSYVVLDQQRAIIPEIRSRRPKARIVVRAYWPNWYALDADVAVHLMAGWWGRDCAPYDCYLTPANEMNLHDEGHPDAMRYERHPREPHRLDRLRMRARMRLDDPMGYPPRSVYEDIRDWCSLFARTIKAIHPGIKLVFPALSWGHSDDQNDAGYIGNDIISDVVEQDYDGNIGVHLYWNNRLNRDDCFYGRRELITHAAHPTWKMFCTEYGANESLAADDAEDYKLWLDELPEFMYEHFSPCPFIWQGAGAMSGWSINKRKRIMRMLQGYKPSSPPVGPAPEVEPERPVGELEALVRSFEGFSRVWVSDGKGHKSIGYGHQGTADEIRLWTAPMERWQALDVLQWDLEEAVAAVRRHVTVTITDTQWLALASLAFNIGAWRFGTSDLVAKLNWDYPEGAALEFLSRDEKHGWIFQNGAILPGLVERRAIERRLFESK